MAMFDPVFVSQVLAEILSEESEEYTYRIKLKKVEPSPEQPEQTA